MRNRSVPADILLPHIRYRDVIEAVEWLTRMFGFAEHYRYGEPVSGAQLHLGAAYTWSAEAIHLQNSAAPPSLSQSESEDFAALYLRAFAEYGPRALWSMSPVPDPTPADALAIAPALRTHGGMDGRRLAERIERLCRAAD